MSTKSSRRRSTKRPRATTTEGLRAIHLLCETDDCPSEPEHLTRRALRRWWNSTEDVLLTKQQCPICGCLRTMVVEIRS